MKLYEIAKIKKYFKNNNKLMEDRNTLDDFLSPKSFYDKLYIRNLYADTTKESTYYIDEKELEVLTLLCSAKYSGNFDYSDFPSTELNDNIKLYKVKSYDDYLESLKAHGLSEEMLELVRKRKEVEKEVANRKKNINQPFAVDIKNLSLDFHNKKIVCVDFEFFHKGSDHKLLNCFEFGVSIKDKHGNYYHKHYLIEETYQKKGKASIGLQSKFRFGETETISHNEVKKVLEDYFKDADYLLFHDMGSELRIFRQNNIFFDKQKIKVLDTQQMQKNFENGDFIAKKLKALLSIHGMPDFDLHNSGNDAAYTLMLLMKMSEKYKEQQQISKKNKKIEKKAKL